MAKGFSPEVVVVVPDVLDDDVEDEFDEVLEKLVEFIVVELVMVHPPKNRTNSSSNKIVNFRMFKSPV